jgi:flavin-dependent dehydrogenase
MNGIHRSYDVAVIGAGPAGAVAAANLARRGLEVVVLERETFPRFSIGESLLPQSMAFLDEAGLLPVVQRAGFQLKNGAMFDRANCRSVFEFSDKSTPGWADTYQVQRARFDKLLADEAGSIGAQIHYGYEIVAATMSDDGARLVYRAPDGHQGEVRADFCLDASGFGRTLVRLLNLDAPAAVPMVRQSIFTHVVDNMNEAAFDRNKILITVHPVHHSVWFWLIPFSDGTSSVGVVGTEAFFARYRGDQGSVLRDIIGETGLLAELLGGADYQQRVRQISGYASAVKKLHGPGFALLGNAGGFLDPVFSSGVTIALKSASLAGAALHRQFDGQVVNWETDFAMPLNRGVETFRQFVAGWYDGKLQDIIFAARRKPTIQRMICAILAGYAWDEANPYVAQPERRLSALADACRLQ